MNTYKYTAFDKKGRKVTGKITGEDIKKVRKTLKEKGIYVIEVKEDIPPTLYFRTGIREEDIIIAMRELATFVSSKLPLDDCLTGVISQIRQVRLKKVFQEIQKKIREGKSFSDALRDFPAIFPEMIVSMVRAGEETGTLDKILVRISDFLERRHKFRNRIMSIMSYPLFMLVISIVVFIFLLSFVTPTITRMFTQINMTLPLPTLILIKISHFFKTGWIYVVAIIFLIWGGIKKLFASEKGEEVKDFIRFRIPVLNNILLKREIILFSTTTATLIDGGVDIIESFQIAGQVLSSRLLRKDIDDIIELLSKGSSLSASFRNSRYFPALVTQLVSAGEKSSSLAEMFNRIGEIYEEEVAQSSVRLANFIEPMMILLMGIVVGVIVLAILLPIFQISQSIR
ncbi:MAG: type II secretion system F family protein [Candidatus Omnitrophica bacterium]|nr:type II secretion system F family protein [Candidatus Omnitrophota bacterium]MCM8777297.1 type II secretion system F family protein [Candidatus Omnitrophota bacterium]